LHESANTVPAVPVSPRAITARRITRRIKRIAAAFVALYCFILALALLKSGAVGAASILRLVAAEGFTNLLGFGWIAAYLSLSGSPVAALSLGLLGGGAITPLEALGMINGSRLGASCVVLVIGFVYYLRGGQRGRGVISMGILSMLTTATIYVPAMFVAIWLVRSGLLGAMRFGSSQWSVSIVDLVVGRVVAMIDPWAPPLALFVAGYIGLLLSFRLFERSLPHLTPEALQRGRLGGWIYRPVTMFAAGLAVTAVTMSVSVSLSILVPLAARGLVTRRQVIPYIMGCNITTFIDTLFVALLITRAQAFTVVLAEMISVAAVSLVVLLTAFPAYQRALLSLNSTVASTKTRFAVFVGVMAAVPVVLLVR
jgi:sodium-dependent phosphate cotransporter